MKCIFINRTHTYDNAILEDHLKLNLYSTFLSVRNDAF